MTTRIVHENQVICVETLDVKGMTRSAKGTREKPGTGVGRKTRINKALLDASMGELLRQLEVQVRVVRAHAGEGRSGLPLERALLGRVMR